MTERINLQAIFAHKVVPCSEGNLNDGAEFCEFSCSIVLDVGNAFKIR